MTPVVLHGIIATLQNPDGPGPAAPSPPETSPSLPAMLSPSSPTPRRAAHRAPGFTLIELLTVIAIIGILAAIIIPTVGAVRQRAKAAQCTSNLRQLALGCQLFAQDNKDFFPQFREIPASTRDNPNPRPVPWYIALSTYTGQRVVDSTVDDTRGLGLIHQCPGSQLAIDNAEKSTYAVHAWLFAQRSSNPSVPPTSSRIPRPSQVIIFGDAPQAHEGGRSNDTLWELSGTGPWNENRDPDGLSPFVNDVDAAAGAGYLRYRHGDSANTAYLDGHVASAKRGTLKNGNFLLTK